MVASVGVHLIVSPTIAPAHSRLQERAQTWASRPSSCPTGANRRRARSALSWISSRVTFRPAAAACARTAPSSATHKIDSSLRGNWVTSSSPVAGRSAYRCWWSPRSRRRVARAGTGSCVSTDGRSAGEAGDDPRARPVEPPADHLRVAGVRAWSRSRPRRSPTGSRAATWRSLCATPASMPTCPVSRPHGSDSRVRVARSDVARSCSPGRRQPSPRRHPRSIPAVTVPLGPPCPHRRLSCVGACIQWPKRRSTNWPPRERSWSPGPRERRRRLPRYEPGSTWC